jgi:hypothetical protein
LANFPCTVSVVPSPALNAWVKVAGVVLSGLSPLNTT